MTKEDIKKLKKSGNKVYSLGQRLEQSLLQGMNHRIPGYLSELTEVSKEIEELSVKMIETQT